MLAGATNDSIVWQWLTNGGMQGVHGSGSIRRWGIYSQHLADLHIGSSIAFLPCPTNSL